MTTRCVLIGESALMVRCGEALLTRGWTIVGVYSPDDRVIRWAQKHAITTGPVSGDLAARLTAPPFELLLSIVNHRVLSDAVLSLPRWGSINFHDGPLPQYAGLHATNWALLRDEPQHGVAWHIAAREVDSGGVLVEEQVQINPDDTAFSLNSRCQEAGLIGFQKLLTRLEGGLPESESVEPTLYFGRHQRPEGAGYLDLEQSAASVERLVRALSFGPADNPFLSARLWTGAGVLLVGSARLIQAAHAEPGTVLARGPDWIRVAASGGALELGGLRQHDGSPLSSGLPPVGHCIPPIPPAHRAELTWLAEQASRSEAAWLRLWSQAEPCTIPLRTHPIDEGMESVSIPERDLGLPPGRAALVCALIGLSRLLDRSHLLISAHTPPEGSLAPYALVEPQQPWWISIDPTQSLSAIAQRLSGAVDRLRRRVSPTADLWHRRLRLRSAERPSTAITIGAPGAPTPGQLDIQLTAGSAVLRFLPGTLDPAVVSALRRLPAFGQRLQPADPILSTSLVEPDEHAILLQTWNDTAAPFPAHRPMHAMFEDQVRHTPDREAVCDRSISLTYRQLEERSRALAARLISMGVGPEVRVGLCLRRSVDLVVSVLGVSRAGGAWVPLDPSYPRARLDYIAEDASVAVLITTSDVEGPSLAEGTLRLDLDRPSSPVVLDLPEVSPSSLAYVIYTSGSTGQPKGVAITHHSAVAMLAWAQQEFSPEELRSVLASTSICFDMSVFELYAPLWCGGRVVVVENFLDWAESPDLEVSLLDTVPSALREYVRRLASGSSTLPDAGVIAINLGGEPLPQKLVEDIYSAIPQVEKVRDLYGPSEDTTFTTCSWRKRGDIHTVGRPLTNTRLYILDSHRQPVPIGIIGELYIAGEGLARGYLGQPDRTAKSFVPDPFGAPGARMYRTRDLCRYRPDGRVEYIGRADHQIKLRGFRIELKEIETLLNARPDVEQSVAVIRSCDREQKLLVAYVVPRGETSQVALREHLRERLPTYMVPSAFVLLPELPQTLNGKIDRKRLPAPDLHRGALSSSYVAPRTEQESAMAALWASVLGVEAVGVEDNFFELGGHSLLALQIIEGSSAQLGIHARLPDLLSARTITGLLEAAAARQPTTAHQADPVVPATSTLPERVWMGISQLALWFSYHPDQLNVPLFMAIENGGSPDRIQAALDSLVQLQPSLGYTASTLAPVLTRGDPDPVPLQHLSLSPGSSPDELAERIKKTIHAGVTDFRRGCCPQIRGLLVTFDTTRALLVLKYPHYLGDGYTNELIEDTLRSLLVDDPVQPPTTTFADEIEAEAHRFSAEAIKERRAYWDTYLSGCVNIRAQRSWYFSGKVKPRRTLRLSNAPLERLRRHHRLLYRTLYASALLHAFRQLTGQADIFIRNFVLSRRKNVVREPMYPRLYLEAFRARAPLSADSMALLRAVEDGTHVLSRDDDLLLPLAYSGMFSEAAAGRRKVLGTALKLLGGLYSFVGQAPPEQQRLLKESLAGFTRDKNQLDVYLNFVPQPKHPPARDSMLRNVISRLHGAYPRRCTGDLRDFFSLDVIDLGSEQIISLDSPLSEDTDQRIIELMQAFFDELMQAAASRIGIEDEARTTTAASGPPVG